MKIPRDAKASRGFLVAVIIIGASGSVQAEEIWRGDFETGDVLQWSQRQIISPDRAQVVEDPVRQGFYAVQIELRNGDYVSGGNRAELVNTHYELQGQERWYRWSTLWPDDYPIHPRWQIFTQWHHDGCCGSPPLYFYLSGTEIRLATIDARENELLWWSTPLVTGVWHDFMLHVSWSSDPDQGFIELFYNGDLVLPLTYVATMKAGIPRNYLKQGLYRHPSITQRAFIYHDGMIEATNPEDLYWDGDY
jgi:hypothetical protein